MPNFISLKRIYSFIRSRNFSEHILPLQEQIKAWQKANRKMSWKIREEEFESLASIPVLTEDDIQQGFIGAALFYGGLLIALWRARRPAFGFTLIWLAGSLIPSLVTSVAPTSSVRS